MTALKFVREVKNSTLLLLGVVEEGELARYTVSASCYADMGCPEVGDLLTEDQLSMLKEADELHRARKKALSLLSYADNNRRNLMTKLSRAGFSRDVASDITDEMVSLGYVNEERQLQRLVLNEANVKLRGPGRIIPALVAKGYSSSDVRKVLKDLCDSGEIDFKKNAKLFIEKKLPQDTDIEEKKKILFKNGYKV